MLASCSHLCLLGLLLCFVGLASTKKLDQWMIKEVNMAVGYFRDMMGTSALEAAEREHLIANYAYSNLTTRGSQQCKRDMTVLEAAAAMPENNPWIYAVQNSNGKFPEIGFLLGKRASVGSYDLCLSVKPTNKPVYDPKNITSVVGLHDFKMRYCKAIWFPPEDFLGYAEGWCVPNSCGQADVTAIMPDVPDMQWKASYCGEVTPISKNVGGIVALTVLSIFVFLVIAASLFDLGYVRLNQKKNEQSKLQKHISTGKGASDTQKKPPCPGLAIQAVLSFSLQRNVPSLLQTTQRGYGCMNGIRFLCMSWVVLGHAWILDLAQNSANFPANLLLYTRLGHQIIMNAGFSVDTFFFLSGCLVTISFMKAVEQIVKRKDKIVSTIKFLGLYVFHRYWRLTPLYAAIIMIYTNLWMYMGSGPLWPPLNGSTYFCKDNWWTNLLYVNNLVRAKEMCMGWSWYLPNDFQFFLILPVFGFALFLNQTLGSIFQHNITLGWAGSLVCRLVLVMQYKTSFDDLYSKPWSRFGPYAIGIATGYIMYRTKCKVKMNRWVAALGWGLATGLMLALVLGTYKNGNWTVDMHIAYKVTMRDAFSLGLAWVVFACCSGYGGPFDTFLSWQLWIPLSKLCYGCYLLHPIVSFLALSNRKELFYIQDITVIYQYFGTLVITMAVAFVMALIFEVPFIKLEKVILPSPKKDISKHPPQPNEPSTSTNQTAFHGNQAQEQSSPHSMNINQEPGKLNQHQHPGKQESESVSRASGPLLSGNTYEEIPAHMVQQSYL